MILQPDPIAEFACFIVFVCWLGFGAIVVMGKRGAARGAAKRDVISTLGLALQMAAYAICFIFFRTYFSPFLPMSKIVEMILAVFTALLALVPTWFCYAAARALGRHWALMARVIEGHELVQQGPFAIVRNPIYFAMLGMLIAVGLAVSRWQGLLAAIFVYLAGTWIRIHAEETLLRETFGAKFDDYARRVPAFLPRFSR
ncbi:MAG TPA: isoprenylcysteine carboxylmethyltransferase family protein [Candidatus Acidoferrales bacterium]|nr:isoprenylcysteine carboxylmethyltransferase family protein [Candidatus Acidoferrales bacterium]